MCTSWRLWTDAVLVGTVTFSCSTAAQRLAKSILHCWWRRYCALCDKTMRVVGWCEAHGLIGRDRQLTTEAREAGPTLEEREQLSLPDSTDSAQEFRDRTTELPLNPEMVKRARMLEMQTWRSSRFLKTAIGTRAWLERVDHRSRLTRSTQTRAIRSGPNAGAGWSVRRRAGGQQLMWKTGQPRLPQVSITRHSVCS